MALAEVYSFREDWHQAACASPLIRQYQVALDVVLNCRPDLQGCAVGCCHCGIRFLTHPRNANRENLRCPFGCRKHHRRLRANERSRLHSQSDSAKRKKKCLNGKRSQRGCEPQIALACDDCGLAVSVEKSATAELVNAAGNYGGGQPDFELNPVAMVRSDELVGIEGAWEALPEQEHIETETVKIVGLPLEGCVLDEDRLVTSSVLPYVRMVASLILQRTISCEELLARLRRHMRQHSIGRSARGGYVLPYVNKHPP